MTAYTVSADYFLLFSDRRRMIWMVRAACGLGWLRLTLGRQRALRWVTRESAWAGRGKVRSNERRI
jgi:hypothetical protein